MAASAEKPPAEIIVTATRSGVDPHLVPNQVETLSAEQAEQRLVRTVPEALELLPGVHVQKTSHGQGSPYIRGFTGFRTLALIDGVRFNNSIFRDGPNEYWNTIDPWSIDSLELVQGQGSVLYGSDAIGGIFPSDQAFGEEWNNKPTIRESFSLTLDGWAYLMKKAPRPTRCSTFRHVTQRR